jgi:recombination protein RecT
MRKQTYTQKETEMQNQIQNTDSSIAVFMRKPHVIQKFTDVLGEQQAKQYIQSVLIEVATDPKLSECTIESVYRSSLRAASLGLSCDKSLKQAWLIPYSKNIGTRDNPKWIKEAQFQPHYKGLYTLAMRTGKYWQINVSPVYEGQRVLENTLTGLHAVREESSGIVGKPDAFNAAYTDVTTRRKSNQKVIGWIGYFKTKKGFEKSVWMSSVEIDDHARKYVKDYDKNPNWGDAEKRPVMEMKTVLRALLSWADMSGTENSQLTEALQADDPAIEAVAEDVVTAIPEAMTILQARQVTVTRGTSEKVMEDLDVETLNEVYLSEVTSDLQRAAAAMVLAQDFQMDPPSTKPRDRKQIMSELQV